MTRPTPVSVGNALDFDGYPLSAAMTYGDRVETAGVIPVSPSTGELVAGNIEVQTRQTLENLSAILTAAGSSLAHVLFADVVLADLADFPAYNTVYREFFTAPYPARRTIGAALALPGLLVEIRATAIAAGA